MGYWQAWKYKNLTLWFVSIIIVALLAQFDGFHLFIWELGTLGYVGAFIAGMLFVSTFTVAIGVLLLVVLGEILNPFGISVIAGLGAMTADFIIFKFVKDHLAEELISIYNHFGGFRLSRLMHHPLFSWTLPVIGAFIIASPFPDELGVSLLGVSRMKTYQFVFLSFLLNSLGIFVVVTASVLI